jgi:hypothetical protein
VQYRGYLASTVRICRLSPPYPLPPVPPQAFRRRLHSGITHCKTTAARLVSEIAGALLSSTPCCWASLLLSTKEIVRMKRLRNASIGQHYLFSKAGAHDDEAAIGGGFFGGKPAASETTLQLLLYISTIFTTTGSI